MTNSFERRQEPIQIQRSIDHQLVHEGRVFTFDVDFGIVGAAINNLIIQTGNSAVHLRRVISFNETGKHIITLYENPTITQLGNSQTIICVNRVSSEIRESDSALYKDGVVTVSGEPIAVVHDFAKSGGGSMTNDAVPEYILNKNANYYLKCQHYTPSGNVAISLGWYEYEH